MKTIHHKALAEQRQEYARLMRHNLTTAEQVLWQALRNRKLLNYKFRRQQQLGYRIVDFVCYEKKLVIELDGIHHMEDIKIIEDQDRSNELQDMGFRVLRFSNEEVIYGFAMVIDKIQDELDK